MDAEQSDITRVWVARAIGAALLVAIVIIGFQVARIRAEARALTALDRNLRDIGLALKAYAAANDDYWFPPPAAAPGVLFFDADALFPEYLDDPGIAISPRRPDASTLMQRLGENPEAALIEAVGAESFIYLGYVVPHAAAAGVFSDAYRAAVMEGVPPWPEDLTAALPGDYDGPGAIGVRRLPRVRDAEDRRPIPVSPDELDAWMEWETGYSERPILLERPIAEGAAIRVLYMDGHLKSVPHGEFPNTRAVLDALESLRELRAGGGMAPAVTVP